MPKIIVIATIIFILAIILVGCGHYQPPGEDLWEMV